MSISLTISCNNVSFVETDLYAGSKSVISLRIDEMGSSGYRSRINKTTYGFSAMREKLYSSRIQLDTIFGTGFTWRVLEGLAQLEVGFTRKFFLNMETYFNEKIRWTDSESRSQLKTFVITVAFENLSQFAR